MRTSLFTLFALLALAVNGQPMMVGDPALSGSLTGSTNSGGGSCPADGSPNAATTNGENAYYVGANAYTAYIGQNRWSDSVQRTICKVGFDLTANGTISGRSFKAYIFLSQTNGFDPSSPLAVSTGVTGNNSWSSTMVRFSFTTPYTTTANTNYTIVVSQGGTYGSGWALTKQTSVSQFPGGYDGWYTNGTCGISCSSTLDVLMELYYQ